MKLKSASLLGVFLVSGQYGLAQTLSDAAFIERAQNFALVSLDAAPLDPSNRFDGDPLAIAFGEQLFFDKGLSKNGDVSCASCHVTENAFVPNESIRADEARKFRTVMPIEGVAHQNFLFWDGRADSAWMQAIGPLENDFEHDLTRAEIASYVNVKYPDELVALAPDLMSTPLSALEPASPAGNREERAAWRALPPESQEWINQIFALVGKSIAAYETSLPVSPSRWDKVIEDALDDISALSELSQAERNGFELFTGKARCATCHDGPLFTDADFHNTGLPQSTAPIDLGRQSALLELRNNPFNCLGRYSDAQPEDCGELTYMSLSMERAMGAFRTPTLRGVSKRAFLGHAGQISSIEEMIRHYNAAPTGPHGALVGLPSLSELVPLGLSEAEISALTEFLSSL